MTAEKFSYFDNDTTNANLEYERWRGKSDGLYHLSFLKTFDEIGFTKEQLFEILMKKLNNERDISIVEFQSREMENDEPCDCDECKAARGEVEPEL